MLTKQHFSPVTINDVVLMVLTELVVAEFNLSC
jgi:hypothetical protein